MPRLPLSQHLVTYGHANACGGFCLRHRATVASACACGRRPRQMGADAIDGVSDLGHDSYPDSDPYLFLFLSLYRDPDHGRRTSRSGGDGADASSLADPLFRERLARVPLSLRRGPFRSHPDLPLLLMRLGSARGGGDYFDGGRAARGRIWRWQSR